MPSMPQLLDEDIQEIDGALRELLSKSGATATLLAAEGGFLVLQQGDTSQFDATTLGALAANAFSATEAIAQLLNEGSFCSLYQQGLNASVLICQVNRLHALIVVFPAEVTVGAVKYFAAFAIRAIAVQLTKARDRAPGQGLDLATLNLEDSSSIFRMKSN